MKVPKLGLALLPLGLVLAVGFPSAPGQAQAPPPGPRPAAHRIVVTGRGVVNAVPDRVAIVLVAVGAGGTQAAAQQQREAAVQTTVRALAALGIAPQTIETSRFAGPHRRPGPQGGPRGAQPAVPAAPNYIAVARMALSVNTPALATRVVAAATTGGMRVARVRASLRDPSASHAQALRLAVQHAQADAAAMASAAGAPSPQLVQMQELSFGSSFPGGMEHRGAGGGRSQWRGRQGTGWGPGRSPQMAQRGRPRAGHMRHPGGATVPQTVPVTAAVRAVYTF